MNDQQFGFRTNRSTSMALTKLVEEISNAVDNKQFIVSVFIDLMKAFNTIDHRILTMKLERYGIRGTAHNWIQSYMEERFQFVSITNVNSNLTMVTYGTRLCVGSFVICFVRQ